MLLLPHPRRSGDDNVIMECLDFLEKHEFMRLQAIEEGEDKPVK